MLLIPRLISTGTRRLIRLLALLTVMPISACLTVGPDYEAPETLLAQEFEHASGPEFTSKPPMANLWKQFDDEKLNTLIGHGLVNNHEIGAALAKFDESRAILGLSRYSYFPTVTAAASSTRSSQSSDDPFTFEGIGISKVHQLQFDSTWEIDLFGSLRRQNQQITRLTESDQATLQDVQRSIVGEIVQSYFALRGAQEQLNVQQQNLNNQSRAVEILNGALRAGRGTGLDVARAQSLEQSIAAAIPATQAIINRMYQRLAVLTAQPGETLRAFVSSGALPVMPEQIDVGTPDQWLRRRPDVRAAERLVAMATAAVGVEVAEFYPKLTLLGSFGYSSDQISNFGEKTAQRWDIGPSLQWRFLDFGRVKQYVRAAQARERQAIAVFQNALLRAVEDMENALATYRTTSNTAVAIEQALGYSHKARDLAQLRFDNGASSYLELLDAERTRLELADQNAQAVTARATALAAVYKALAVN